MQAKSLRLYSTFLILAPMASGQERAPARCTQQRATAEIRPFQAHVPDSVLADLDRRLAATKWPDQLPGTSWEYGADIKKVRELADYWQTQCNWRAQEARIDRFHQFTTVIDAQQIHFIHVDSFVRLYMVPGLQHCLGGPGPDSFGAAYDLKFDDPQHSVDASLEQWVEKGTAPSTIIASKFEGEDETHAKMTRPLCPYPQAAKYKGSGDANDAANFECVRPKK